MVEGILHLNSVFIRIYSFKSVNYLFKSLNVFARIFDQLTVHDINRQFTIRLSKLL